MDPLVHAFDEVLRVRIVNDGLRRILIGKERDNFCRSDERHAIIRRVG